MVENTTPKKCWQIELVGLQLVYRFLEFALTKAIVFMVTRLTGQMVSKGMHGASVSEVPQRPERTVLFTV